MGLLGETDVVNRVGYRKFHPVFFSEPFHCRRGHDPFGEFFEFLSLHEHFPVHPVVRMAGKEGRFIIAEMCKPVSRQLVAPERFDQPRDFPRAARHERTFQRGHAAAVEHARRNAHHVFRRRADLRADDVVAVVKTDEIALEIVRKRLFQLRVVAVDDHTVGNARRKVLDMPGPHPDGDLFGRYARADENFRKALARLHFDPLHTEHEDLIRNIGARLDFADKPAKTLRTDRDDDDLRPLHRCFQIAGEGDRLVQRDIVVFPRFFENFIGIVIFGTPRPDLFALFRREIPRDKRAPSAAAQNGNSFHRFPPYDAPFKVGASLF